MTLMLPGADFTPDTARLLWNVPAYPSPKVRTGPALTGPTFEDSWWDDKHWNYLREAGAQRRTLDTIDLGDPPDEVTTNRELQDIVDKQRSASAQDRRADIIEQAVQLPSFLKRIVMADELRNKHTNAVIDLAVSFPRPAIMYFKHIRKRARPTQLDPRIRPVVDCPNHPAYPSGHSTQLHLVALALGEVSGRTDIKDEMLGIAAEVAENREWAGLHYPSDSQAGARLATALLPIFVQANGPALELARSEWR
jgi:hypothetical protein